MSFMTQINPIIKFMLRIIKYLITKYNSRNVSKI